jgi:hypothetical protein
MWESSYSHPRKRLPLLLPYGVILKRSEGPLCVANLHTRTKVTSVRWPIFASCLFDANVGKKCLPSLSICRVAQVPRRAPCGANLGSTAVTPADSQWKFLLLSNSDP